jgi:hypothetical protein
VPGMTNAADIVDDRIAKAGGAAAVVQRVVKRAAKAAEKAQPLDPADLFRQWIVTAEQVDAMAATRMAWYHQIAESHMAAWIAPPNGGKTTLAKLAAGELASKYQVLFFQEDVSAGDIPALFEHAQQHQYQLLNSTLAGSSTEDQINVLRRLVKQRTPLVGVVMFFDTLKKYADLMSKGGARAFFKLMRSLTQLGATIILLGHTNKHRGVDGKLMFEGVGDVRNDVDELIYIDATEKDPRGIVTLTMRPDKTRCAIEEATFELDTRQMQVRRLDRVVNVAALMERKRRFDEDEPVIACVKDALRSGGMKHTELCERVKATSGKSRSVVTQVIERYLSDDVDNPDALWIETRMRVNNTRHISLKPGAA